MRSVRRRPRARRRRRRPGSARLEVRTYYIANDSVGRAGWPALRVKALTESGGAAQFRDEEVMPGVEDLQVEFGVAPGTTRARRSTSRPTRDAARTGPIVAVRLWLRIRADTTEGGFRRRCATLELRRCRVSCRRQLEARQRRMLDRADRRACAMRGRHEDPRQRGTTLVVGLILLSVVTLLGLAGASTARDRAQLAQNGRFRENAASAASAGIEYAISRIVTHPCRSRRRAATLERLAAGLHGPVRNRHPLRRATTSRCRRIPARTVAGAHFEIVEHRLFRAPRSRPSARRRHAGRSPIPGRGAARTATRRAGPLLRRRRSRAHCPGSACRSNEPCVRHRLIPDSHGARCSRPSWWWCVVAAIADAHVAHTPVARAPRGRRDRGAASPCRTAQDDIFRPTRALRATPASSRRRRPAGSASRPFSARGFYAIDMTTDADGFGYTATARILATRGPIRGYALRRARVDQHRRRDAGGSDGDGNDRTADCWK